MSNNKKQKKICNVSFILIIIFSLLLLVVLIVNYLNHVDKKVKEMENTNDIVYTSSNNVLQGNGLYKANIKDDLDGFLKKKDVTSVTYKLDNDDFYMTFDVLEDDAEKVYRLEKIVSDKFKVNARVGIKDVKSVEYRTGNPDLSTVVKIDCFDYNEYFAMSYDFHYMLGKDIESISYLDEHFYYMSYNPKYEILEEEGNCSKATRNKIEGFNKSNYYYRYGKINFLEDYYQKLASKTYTVEEKCKEFEREEN